MKSLKQYAGMLVGSVGVNANRAKRSLVIALNLVHRNRHSVPENVTGTFEPCHQGRN